MVNAFYNAIETVLSSNNTYQNQSQITLDAFAELKASLNEAQIKLLYKYEEEVLNQEYCLCEAILEYISSKKA